MTVYKSPKPTRQVRAKWNKIYREAGKKPKRVVIPDDPVNMAFKMLKRNGKAYRYLDLGCGEGLDVIALAKKGIDCTGMDVSDVAIDRARNFARMAHVNATFICGNPLRKKIDGKFEIVASRFVLHTIRNKYQRKFVELMMRHTERSGFNVLVYHTTYRRGEKIDGFQTTLERFYAREGWKVVKVREDLSGHGFSHTAPIHWKYIIAQKR